MIFSYKYVYYNDLNLDHYKNYEYAGERIFETYGFYIFIIEAIVAAYFAFCIANGIELIKNEYGERLIDESEDKKSTLREFLENYGFILYMIGMIVLCFAILSTLASVDSILSIIEENDRIRRGYETTTNSPNYWDWTTSKNYWDETTTERYYTDYTDPSTTTTAERYYDGPTSTTTEGYYTDPSTTTSEGYYELY